MKEECKMVKDKESTNPNNKYDHNFQGLYCTCNRPYPDPDNEVGYSIDLSNHRTIIDIYYRATNS